MFIYFHCQERAKNFLWLPFSDSKAMEVCCIAIDWGILKWIKRKWKNTEKFF
jgi:hypothetical protein